LDRERKRKVDIKGFFYITNIGLSQEEIDLQFAIAKAFFQLPEEDRLRHRAPLEEGNYNGYRPLGALSLFPGMQDTLEFYSIFKFIPQSERSHPDIINQYSREIEEFSRHMHENVSYKILRILALMLELPEDQFVDGNRYEDECDSSIRYMLYHARSPKENTTFDNVYFRGHTDKGTLTFLFQQPIAALQIQRTKEADWEYLQIPAGSVAVNFADTLQFLTNGYLKSGFHRVIAPPSDQVNLDRLGLLYFVRPTDKLPWKTLDSPVLRRVGYGKTSTENDREFSGLDWWRAGVKSRKGANYMSSAASSA
jgi:isopenicillin N synthase-like dioxygenase